MNKTRESLLITLVLALFVLLFTRFNRDIVIFVAIFVAIEIISLAITHLIKKLKQ